MNRQNNDTVLIARVAKQGDPTAFLTLFEADVEGLYRDMRNAGSTHEQSVSVLLPFVRNSYRKYVGTRPRTDTDGWFQQQRAHLNVSRVAKDSDSESAQQIQGAQLQDVSGKVLHVLQREYSRIRNDGQSSTEKVHYAFSSPLGRTIFILILLCAVPAILYFGLVASGSHIGVTFVSPTHVIRFGVPLGSQGLKSPGELATMPSTSSDADTAFTVDSVVEDSNLPGKVGKSPSTLGKKRSRAAAPARSKISPKAPKSARVGKAVNPKPVRAKVKKPATSAAGTTPKPSLAPKPASTNSAVGKSVPPPPAPAAEAIAPPPSSTGSSAASTGDSPAVSPPAGASANQTAPSQSPPAP